MNLLAFDTSMQACSVALLQGDHLTSTFELSSHQRSRHILSMIERLLAEANLSFSQLDAIAFGSGPGSFTGIRLAASVAQAIAFAQNLPVIPISTMHAMAQGAYDDSGAKTIGVALNAYSGEVYWAVYEKRESAIVQPLLPECRCLPQEVSLDSIKCDRAIGDAWQLYEVLKSQLLPETNLFIDSFPHAKAIATIANSEFTSHISFSPGLIEKALPSYLHRETMWKKQ